MSRPSLLSGSRALLLSPLTSGAISSSCFGAYIDGGSSERLAEGFRPHLVASLVFRSCLLSSPKHTTPARAHTHAVSPSLLSSPLLLLLSATFFWRGYPWLGEVTGVFSACVFYSCLAVGSVLVGFFSSFFFLFFLLARLCVPEYLIGGLRRHMDLLTLSHSLSPH